MRHNPKHAVTDEAVVRQLIAENPWATIVSQHAGELVASHYPVLLDESSEQLAIVTHVGRPDEQVHGFRDREVLLIVAGPHGYVSLSFEDNVATLTRLVAHFEQHVEEPMYLEREVADKIAPGTVGIRLSITRFVCKVKMSQDKDEETQRNVLAQLRGNGPYAQPALADDMQRALS